MIFENKLFKSFICWGLILLHLSSLPAYDQFLSPSSKLDEVVKIALSNGEAFSSDELKQRYAEKGKSDADKKILHAEKNWRTFRDSIQQEFKNNIFTTFSIKNIDVDFKSRLFKFLKQKKDQKLLIICNLDTASLQIYDWVQAFKLRF